MDNTSTKLLTLTYNLLHISIWRFPTLALISWKPLCISMPFENAFACQFETQLIIPNGNKIIQTKSSDENGNDNYEI